jgi:eukaryotic-like serine/threonine-protein kinase
MSRVVTTRILVVVRNTEYGEWLRHNLGAMCPDAIVSVLDTDWFRRAYQGLTRKDCTLLILAAPFGDTPEDPQSEGLGWLRDLRARPDYPPVLAIAEDGNELTAVRALQLGAMDYLPKRLVTQERLKTAVLVALRTIERSRAPAAPKSRDLDAGAAEQDPIERSLSLTVTDEVRDLIPQYTIKRTIGESEKARVYLAQSDALDQEVALKVSRTRRGGHEDRQLLAREYTAISAIYHPSIVEIYDYGMHEGREYLAMEYFPRGDLKARIQLGLLPAEALRYLERIAHALKVVHDAGILHRDLKPPNVMLRENDDIVLIDFGLARALEGGLQSSTRTGVLRGSPYYMSPDQALGEELDPRTDLYSLGVIFYEMLTGRKPFSGSSAIEVLQQHVNAQVPPLPSELVEFQSLLDKLLAKSREARFPSAEALVTAIALFGQDAQDDSDDLDDSDDSDARAERFA